jgi:hypothetical protein
MALGAKERGCAEGEVKKKSKQWYIQRMHIKDQREGKRGNMREYR